MSAHASAVARERIDGASASADGTFAEVHVVRDFDGHHYSERVVLADGTVARDVHQDLREHTGRGSDKPEVREAREVAKRRKADERAVRKEIRDLTWRNHEGNDGGI